MRAPLSWIRDFTPADVPVDELVAALNQLGLEVDAVEEPGREILGVRVARSSTSSRTPTPTSCSWPTSTSATGRPASCAARRTSTRGWWRRSRRQVRSSPAASSSRAARSAASSPTACSVLRASSASVRTTRASSTSTPTPSSARTCVRCSASTTSCSSSRSRRTGPTRCASSASRGLAAHLGEKFAIPDAHTPVDPGVAADATVVIEAPDRCPRYLAPGRAGHDGPVATVDAAAARQGRDAPHQQRRRRDELRPAGAQPAVARVRPRQARREGDRRAPRRGRREDDDARRRRARAVHRRPPHLRRRAGRAGHRGHHGRRDLGGLRHHHRDPARVGVLRAHGHRTVVEAAEAPLRGQRALRARHRPERRRAARGPGHGALRRGRGHGVAAEAVDEYSATGRTGADPSAHVAREPHPRHRPLRRRRHRRAHASRHRSVGIGRRARRARADVPSRSRARDRPDRGSGAAGRVRRDRAQRGPAGRAGRRAHSCPAGPPALSRMRVSARACRRRSHCRWSRPRTSRAGGRPDRSHGRGRESAPGRGVGAADADPARAAARRRLQPRTRAPRRGAVRARPRVPRTRGGGPSPRRAVSPRGSRSRERSRGGHWKPIARSTRTTRSTCCAPSPTRWSSPTGASRRPHTPASTRPARPPCSSTASKPAWSARSTRVSSTRSSSAGPWPRSRSTCAFSSRRIDATAPSGRRSPYPPSNIDLAFVVDDAVAAAAVATTLRLAGGDLVEDVSLFDVFRSDALGAGRKSLAFSIRYRAADRTLTDAEVAGLRDTAIAAVTGAYGAVLRG